MIELFLPNPIIYREQETKLSADSTVGATTLSVDDATGFSVNDYLVVGNYGIDKAELTKISGIPTPTSLAISALSFAHNKYDTIKRIAWNQIQLYSSATKTGTYSLLTTLNIKPDSTVVKYEHSAGASTTYYKWRYYNSTTLDSSEYSNPVNEAAHYCSIDNIREQAGFRNAEGIEDNIIRNYRIQAEGIVNGYITGYYTLPLSSIPDIIVLITKLLAAGYLLIAEYGTQISEDISKYGKNMIDQAMGMLNMIQKGTLKLIDTDGAELGRGTVLTPSGNNYPYDSSLADSGELFNLSNETFKFKDPSFPTS